MPTMRLMVSGEAATRRSNARLSLMMATFIERLSRIAEPTEARTMPRRPRFVKVIPGDVLDIDTSLSPASRFNEAQESS